MALNENLKARRLEKGLTQEELAEAVGISQVNITWFEKGTKVPSIATLVNIADELDCSIDSLLDRNLKN